MTRNRRRIAGIVAAVAFAATFAADARAQLPLLATTTDLATSGPSVYGDTVTFTATTTESLTGTAVDAGQIAFTLAGVVPIAGCAAVPVSAAGVAACPTDALPASAIGHLVTATYSPPPLGLVLGSFDTVTQTVAAAPLTIAADPVTIDYGDPLPVPTATVTGLVLGETGDADCAIAGTPADAGTYVDAVSCTAGTLPVLNYLVTSEPADLTILPVAQTIDFGDPADMTFGDPDQALVATATSGLPVSFASGTPDVCAVVEGKVHPVASGTCEIVASQAGSVNFLAALDVVRELEIDPPLGPLGTETTLVSGGSSVYGDPVTFTSTTLASSVPVGSGTVTFLLGAVPIAGCAAVPVGLDGKATCTTDDLPVSLPAGHVIAATYVPSDPLALLGSADTLAQVVDPATLTVTADKVTAEYGQALPADLTATISGFVLGDTLAAVTGTPECVIAAGTPSGAGLHEDAIECTAGTLAALNYVFAFIPGDLEIVKAGQNLLFPALADSVYGGADQSLGAVAESNLPVGYTSATPAVCSVVSGKAHILAAGTCTITAAQPGDGNWLPATPIDRTFAIAKAPLTVTADPVTVVAGDPLPALTATISGFVLGESRTASVVSGQPACSGPSPLPAAPGTYPGAITCEAGSLTAANYQFAAFEPGTLTVTARPSAPGTPSAPGSPSAPATPSTPPATKPGRTFVAPTLKLLTTRVKGNKRKKVRLRLRSSGPMGAVSLLLKRNGKTVLRGKLKVLAGTRSVTVKGARRLRKGVYTLQATWVDASTRKGKRRFSIRVR